MMQNGGLDDPWLHFRREHRLEWLSPGIRHPVAQAAALHLDETPHSRFGRMIVEQSLGNRVLGEGVRSLVAFQPLWKAGGGSAHASSAS